MKRLIVIIAICINIAFCADRDISQFETVIFTNPNIPLKEQKPSESGSYPSVLLNKMKYVKMLKEAAPGGDNISIPSSKKSFDVIIEFLNRGSLTPDLSLQDLIEVVKTGNALDIGQFETEESRTNAAQYITAQLHNDIHSNSKNYLDILQNNRTALNNFFKDEELASQIISSIDTQNFSPNILKLLTPYKYSHELELPKTYSKIQIHLSPDGDFFTMATQAKLYKKKTETGQIINKFSFADNRAYKSFALCDAYYSIFFHKDSKIIIYDANTNQQKYAFDLAVVENGTALAHKNIAHHDTWLSQDDKRGEVFNLDFFSFSPDEKKLVCIPQAPIATRLHRQLATIIDTHTGETKSFQANSLHSMITSVFDQESTTLYSIFQTLGQIRSGILIPTPLNKSQKKPLPLPSIALSDSTIRPMYTIKNDLYFNAPLPDNRLTTLHTFNTETKQFQFISTFPIFKTLFLSDSCVAIATTTGSKFAYNTIVLCAPPNLFLSKQRILLTEDHVEFKPASVSRNKNMFAFIKVKLNPKTGETTDETTVCFFKKQSLPIDIAFGILCFEKLNDLKTLGEISLALRPVIKELPNEIASIIWKYFSDKTKQAFDKHQALGQ